MLAIPIAAHAAPSQNKVTGGGQFAVSDSGGAGNTIALSAQGTADAAKGQIQLQDRTNGATQHGTVDCVDVTGTMAKIAGTWRDGTFWHLYVVDNGQGAAAQDDMLYLDSNADDNQCDFDTPDQDSQTNLGRGNFQVHKQKASTSGSRAAQRASWSQALHLARL